MPLSYLKELIGLTNTPYSDCFYARNDLLTEISDRPIAKQFAKNRSEKFQALYRDVWLSALEALNGIRVKNTNCATTNYFIENGIVKSFLRSSNSPEQLNQIVDLLIPWRKGPWMIDDLLIDSEWRSDIKYADLRGVKDLFFGKRIIDIGGGNGYYAFRAIEDGADSSLIFDPSEKFFFQFELVQKFFQQSRVQYELGGYQEARSLGFSFDVVFCLGVFYHQKNPIDLVETCRSLLEKDGVLFLESMVLDGDQETLFFPPDRYAKARNVYFLPTLNALISILRRSGFQSIEILNCRETSLEEQRSTKHMPYESLEAFLSPKQSNLTIEGFQRPKRAVLVAKRK